MGRCVGPRSTSWEIPVRQGEGTASARRDICKDIRSDLSKTSGSPRVCALTLTQEFLCLKEALQITHTAKTHEQRG